MPSEKPLEAICEATRVGFTLWMGNEAIAFQI